MRMASTDVAGGNVSRSHLNTRIFHGDDFASADGGGSHSRGADGRRVHGARSWSGCGDAPHGMGCGMMRPSSVAASI